jgi:hypothetical protein
MIMNIKSTVKKDYTTKLAVTMLLAHALFGMAQAAQRLTCLTGHVMITNLGMPS